MDIGEKIKTLRIQQGLTLEQVGNAVGVGKSTVRKWETGSIKNMRRDKIASLADVLGTSPAYLMGWDDTSSTPDNEDGLNEEKRKFIEKISKMDDDVIAALNQLADTIISQRNK